MRGVINFLKPPGMTSFQAVNLVRKMTKARKAGHTGTLDPGAAGVLPICIGKATKIVQFLTAEEKEYRAEIYLGISTTTGDAFGEVVERKEAKADLLQVLKVLSELRGKIEQIPPLYSAVKYKGKRLYELARKGQEVEPEPREVEIKNINLVKYSYPLLMIDVVCSKGTYIRSLARDIGEELGVPAHLSFLLRLRSGDFTLDRALTAEELTEFIRDNKQNYLVPVASALKKFPAVYIDGADRKRAINGAPLRKYRCKEQMGVAAGQLVRVFTVHGEFISIGRIDAAGIIKAVRVFT